MHFMIVITVFIIICFIDGLFVKDSSYYSKLPPIDYSVANATELDVIYKLFTSSEDKGRIVKEDTIETLDFNRNLQAVLIVHGWTTDDTSPWFEPLKKELFIKGPHNVFFINWSKAGNLTYGVSSANCKPVGKYIANFLIKANIPSHKVHIIGHSLGSHVAGFVGKHIQELINGKLGRITALDPAGPCFVHPDMTEDKRLCKEDAWFVDVIHTDSGWFGYGPPLGHVDFYPNKGAKQPGCPARNDFDENCSHARATLFYIESVNKSVKATEATVSIENFEAIIDIVPEGKQVIFGHNIDTSARGTFYIKTNCCSPFLL